MPNNNNNNNNNVIAEPVTFATKEQKNFINQLETAIINKVKDSKLLLKYPIVYIHIWKNCSGKYSVYVGESNDVLKRTKQHHDKSYDQNKWQHDMFKPNADPHLIVIGHEHFNKSLTLDVENRLKHCFLVLMDRIEIKTMNTSAQRNYFPESELDRIFEKIWEKLTNYNCQLFPPLSVVRNSNIYKFSPFHKLNDEQLKAKDEILKKVVSANSNKEGTLIFVEGDAGSGKTVLISSIFFDLMAERESESELDEDDDERNARKLSCCLLVNNDELMKVYQEIAQGLHIKDCKNIIDKPTPFINNSKNIDIAFIDEAHLLLTQGKQGYTGRNHLDDIRKRAKVTVMVFDPLQTVSKEQYISDERIEELRQEAKENGWYISLKEQLRMQAPKEVIDWIDSITKNGKINPLKKSETSNGQYQLEVMDSPSLLREKITKLADNGHKLSRLIASYDWKYASKTDKNGGNPWCVEIKQKDGSVFKMPWNYGTISKKSNSLTWVEHPHTINEIGSIYTIQGFDLEYAGVIIGPSVKYENGKIVFDQDKSKNIKATRNRTVVENGITKMKSFAEDFLQHELRILMTRGVKGMFIYACDEKLQKALKDSLNDH